jgi:arylesterase/paraoxonase
MDHVKVDCSLLSWPEIVIHQPTGILYLACSTLQSRAHWTPAVERLNATGRSEDDYVATYDPKTSRVTRLQVSGYKSNRGLSVHGMDVVPSTSNPRDLFVYLVNHRIPLDGRSAAEVGADSSIEIYKTTSGGSTLMHLQTVDDPIILTPNDVVGSSDGKSFHFTNDYGSKTGFVSAQ